MVDNFMDKYQLHEILGSGATADVYRATDQTLGREVAFRILKPALVTDALPETQNPPEAGWRDVARCLVVETKSIHPNVQSGST